MIFRQLTANNDWIYGGGVANYATGQQAIALNLRTRILMWAGDCFFSLGGWINWKGLLQIGTQKQLDAALQSLIARSYGVQGITAASVVVNRTTRAFLPTYTVSTIYSQQITSQIQILSGQPGN